MLHLAFSTLYITYALEEALCSSSRSMLRMSTKSLKQDPKRNKNKEKEIASYSYLRTVKARIYFNI